MRKPYITALAASLLPMALWAQKRPNIMLIVVDDMGYSDLECFGGEVSSPNLNSLAQDGLRFIQFFNSGRSCPSRACLMTGGYAQQVGITGMGQSLNTQCVTIPEVLREAGYHTAMSGKWHLSLTRGIPNHDEQMAWLSHRNYFNNRPFAPLETYPCNRGFEEHWGTIWGVVDHFDPFGLVHNEAAIYTDSIPADFYSSDFVTQKALDMLDGLAKKEEPFFMYVAYNAPHWPLHAKPEDIAKYKGKYDEGWDVLRERRYQRMVEMGIIDPKETPVAPNECGQAWADVKDKAYHAANMEVHAAMVDCVDQGIGRILADLKAKGIYDNTLIIFTSDNGASPENYEIGEFDRHDRVRSGEKVVHNSPTPGGQLTYNYLDRGWAGAVNTPFRYWKRESFHGGTAAPTIVHWPESIKAQKGAFVKEPCQFIDVMPTCLELAGAEYPKNYKGNEILPLPKESRSLLPLISGKSKWKGQRVLFWEHEGGKAVRMGNWRLTQECNSNQWHLYDLSKDYSETTDLASRYPDKARQMLELWQEWAVRVGLRSGAVKIDKKKTYVISNKAHGSLFVQDAGNAVLTMGENGDAAQWQFIPTKNKDCYYIRNKATGRYVQACPDSRGMLVLLGDKPVEYKVLSFENEDGYFGIASTHDGNADFGNKTIGWNMGEDELLRTFPAEAGRNHRSFWKLTEVE